MKKIKILIVLVNDPHHDDHPNDDPEYDVPLAIRLRNRRLERNMQRRRLRRIRRAAGSLLRLRRGQAHPRGPNLENLKFCTLPQLYMITTKRLILPP